MARRYRAFSVLKEGTAIIQQTTDEIAEYNRSQLRSGFDGKGRRLKAYRSKSYAARKNRANPVPGFGNPDYKVTGAYHEAIRAAVEGGLIKLYTTDPDTVKVDFLRKRDNGAEFGLMLESILAYQKKTIYPDIARSLAAKTGSKLG